MISNRITRDDPRRLDGTAEAGGRPYYHQRQSSATHFGELNEAAEAAMRRPSVGSDDGGSSGNIANATWPNSQTSAPGALVVAPSDEWANMRGHSMAQLGGSDSDRAPSGTTLERAPAVWLQAHSTFSSLDSRGEGSRRTPLVGQAWVDSDDARQRVPLASGFVGRRHLFFLNRRCPALPIISCALLAFSITLVALLLSRSVHTSPDPAATTPPASSGSSPRDPASEVDEGRPMENGSEEFAWTGMHVGAGLMLVVFQVCIWCHVVGVANRLPHGQTRQGFSEELHHFFPHRSNDPLPWYLPGAGRREMALLQKVLEIEGPSRSLSPVRTPKETPTPMDQSVDRDWGGEGSCSPGLGWRQQLVRAMVVQANTQTLSVDSVSGQVSSMTFADSSDESGEETEAQGNRGERGETRSMSGLREPAEGRGQRESADAGMIVVEVSEEEAGGAGASNSAIQSLEEELERVDAAIGAARRKLGSSRRDQGCLDVDNGEA